MKSKCSINKQFRVEKNIYRLPMNQCDTNLIE